MTNLNAGPITIMSNDRFKQAPIPHQPYPQDEGQIPAFETQGYSGFRVVPGNQATYLFFPNFTSMMCIILSTISTPIIKGMSIANIKLIENGDLSGGNIKLGAWGWCLSGLSDFPRPIGHTFEYISEVLPESLKPMKDIGGALPKEYLAASDVMDILSCVVAYWVIGTTLAASGAWSSQWQKAFLWTKIAYWSTFIGTLFTAATFGLEINKYVVLTKFIKESYQVQPKIHMGPVIYLKMAALVIGIGCCAARLLLLQFKPRPIWTMKGRSQDFHPPQPPSDDQPPIWDSLSLNDEKAPLDNQEIREVTTPDFTSPQSNRGTMI